MNNLNQLDFTTLQYNINIHRKFLSACQKHVVVYYKRFKKNRSHRALVLVLRKNHHCKLLERQLFNFIVDHL